MNHTVPHDVKTYLAWRFDRVLSGTFRRNKADFAHHDYPIVGPLPTAGRNTPALEMSETAGPHVYFVCDDKGLVRYVGKSLETQVIQRWVRPGVGGPAKHYWTHSTRSGGAVFEIARGLACKRSTYFELLYLPTANLPQPYSSRFGISVDDAPDRKAVLAEQGFIRDLRPDWNCP